VLKFQVKHFDRQLSKLLPATSSQLHVQFHFRCHFTAIRFDGTTKGALIIDREHAEAVAYDDKHELWVIPRADADKYRAWLDAEYPKPLKRDSWQNKMGAIASKLVTARRNPSSSRKDRAMIKDQGMLIRSLEDKLRKRQATNVEMTLDGFINAPFPMENGVILHWGGDRFFVWWDEDGKLRFEYVEANWTSGTKTPSLTDNQRKVMEAIRDGQISIRFWHYYQTGDGELKWDLMSHFGSSGEPGLIYSNRGV